MKHHYVWLIWSSAFLLPWIALHALNPEERRAMWRTSFATALLGALEPIYVPTYWNPPSLFELAQRTGFDIESFIFMFAIGGVSGILYNSIRRRHLVPVMLDERQRRLHRFHLAALLVPFALFAPLYFLPWNPIYPSIVCLMVGAVASAACRPGLKGETLVGGLLFLGLYGIFMFGLKWFAPGYIERVWNLPALSGILIYGIPLEELLFGFTVGLYWTGVYEHFTWHRSVAHAHEGAGP